MRSNQGRPPRHGPVHRRLELECASDPVDEAARVAAEGARQGRQRSLQLLLPGPARLGHRLRRMAGPAARCGLAACGRSMGRHREEDLCAESRCPRAPGRDPLAAVGSTDPLEAEGAAVYAFPMSVCTACGTENPTGSRFCGGCGAVLSQVCAACGAASEPGMRFCTQCGTPFELDVAAQPQPAAPPEARLGPVRVAAPRG